MAGLDAPVPLADLAAKKDVLREAITNAIRGSQQDRLVRDGHVAAAKAMLRHLADYVRMVAQGDAVVLGASGFALATVPQPIGVLGAPMVREVRMTGRHGEVLLRWSGIHGRRAYHIWGPLKTPFSRLCSSLERDEGCLSGQFRCFRGVFRAFRFVWAHVPRQAVRSWMLRNML